VTGDDARGGRFPRIRPPGEPALRPLVDTAVSRARQADMATLPLIVGACILALSLLPRAEITEENGRRTTKWVFDPAGNAASLLGKLTELVKALPPAVVVSLAAVSIAL
jgi:hypothetical protein